MASPVRIIGKSDARDLNEAIAAQVDRLGNLMVREGALPGLNKTYEDSSFEAGDSPAVHNFLSDTGRRAQEGWIICDGDGDIQVDYSRDGITYGDKFTVKSGEVVDFLRLDIARIRVTYVSANSGYRIFLV